MCMVNLGSRVCEGDVLFAELVEANPVQDLKFKSDLEPGSQANAASFQFLRSTNMMKMKESV